MASSLTSPAESPSPPQSPGVSAPVGLGVAVGVAVPPVGVGRRRRRRRRHSRRRRPPSGGGLVGQVDALLLQLLLVSAGATLEQLLPAREVAPLRRCGDGAGAGAGQQIMLLLLLLLLLLLPRSRPEVLHCVSRRVLGVRRRICNKNIDRYEMYVLRTMYYYLNVMSAYLS